MPTPISDRKLATLYARLEAQGRTNPSLTLSADKALEILSIVGDRSSVTSAQVLTQLKQPGLTFQQQVDIAKRGLSTTEKKDIEFILDRGSVRLDAMAKRYLEAVVGRNIGVGGSTVSVIGLRINSSQANGIEGVTKAGATIEATNLSAVPMSGLRTEDTFVIARADANGTFTGAKLTGDLAMKEGDHIRIRARFADGTTSDWLNIKADTFETADTRNAALVTRRIALTADANDTILVEDTDDARPISEPEAQLQFTNERTGAKQVVTLDREGHFPKNLKLAGKAGDAFSVAVSDGVNNPDFSVRVHLPAVAAGPVSGAAENERLARQIVGPAGSGTADDVDAVVKEMALLPQWVLAAAVARNIKVVACRNSVTDADPRLRGVTPRGWPPGSTWDMVPGAGGDPVIISTMTAPDGGRMIPPTGHGHGSTSLLRHEFAHALGRTGALGVTDRSSDFVAAYESDRSSMTSSHKSYLLQPPPAGTEEAFADMFDEYFGKPDSAKTWGPHMYAFLDSVALRAGGVHP